MTNNTAIRSTDTIRVLESRFPAFIEKVGKINRKAVRAGIEPVEYVAGEPRREVIRSIPSGNGYGFVDIYGTVIPVAVTRTNISLGKYTFLGGITHEPEGNILRTVPGESIPVQYHNANADCQHCNIKRRRDNTFVFRDDDTGEYKQVGSTCLHGFFGYDPINHLTVAESIGEIKDELENDFIGGRVPFEDCQFSLTDVVSMATIVISKYGYRSNKSAREFAVVGEYMPSTADLLKLFFSQKNPNWTEKEKTEYDDFWTSMRSDASREKAETLINWGRNHFATGETDYAHNMRTLLKNDYIRAKYLSYIASLIPAYERAKAQERKNTETRRDNVFLGKEKEKLTVDVIVEKVIPIYGQYGLTYTVIMSELITGNNLVWFASNPKNMESGRQYRITGTVKAHNVRDGKNQTILTRCKTL